MIIKEDFLLVLTAFSKKYNYRLISPIKDPELSKVINQLENAEDFITCYDTLMENEDFNPLTTFYNFILYIFTFHNDKVISLGYPLKELMLYVAMYANKHHQPIIEKKLFEKIISQYYPQINNLEELRAWLSQETPHVNQVDNIGLGTYAEVYPYPNNTHPTAAIKLFSKIEDAGDIEGTKLRLFFNEAITYWLLRNAPNSILKANSVGYFPFRISLAYANAGDLADFIIHGDHQYLEDHQLELICQVLSGLIYAHAMGILHCDINPRNIMVFKEPSKHSFKIGDWGGATLKSRKGMELEVRTSIDCRAPEIKQINNLAILDSEKSDIYSTAIVWHHMCKKISESCAPVHTSMLSVNPEARPTAQEAHNKIQPFVH